MPNDAIRIRPLGILSKAPAVTAKPINAGSVFSRQITSRVDIPSTEVCPVCQKLMGVTTANGHRVRFCVEDRVVLPCEDS